MGSGLRIINMPETGSIMGYCFKLVHTHGNLVSLIRHYGDTQSPPRSKIRIFEDCNGWVETGEERAFHSTAPLWST
jgi:hypothetical protein